MTAQSKKQAKKLTGKHVLLMICAFFGVIFIVNAIMFYWAFGTFRGEDTERSYRQGLAYNQTIEKRAVQIASGWRADITINPDYTINLRITDHEGETVRGLAVKGLLKHPAETDLDVKLKFAQAADGSYLARLGKAQFGAGDGKQWRILTTAREATQKPGGTSFNTNNEIWLKQ